MASNPKQRFIPEQYLELERKADYVLIAQDEPCVEHFIRQQDGGWLYYVVKGLESKLQIASIDCTISLAQLYDKIKFPEDLQT
jgi:hypothetical protein